MTKENKIGLLVGLAFIIAVGILISNYLSTDNQPAPAPLQLAGSAVRSSLGDATASNGDPLANPSVVRVPPTIAPAAPVPTSAELAARARRPATPTVAPIAPIQTDTDPIPPIAFASVPTTPAPVPPALNPDLAAAARRAGQELVPAPNNAAPVPSPARSAMQTVTAEPGDSLGELAERAYGSSTKATRAALIAANPALQANPDRIVAGRSYAVAPATSDATTPTATTPTAKSTTAVVMYTVQPHDTLWSIAANEVGTPQAVAAIRDLNADVLHGDHLRVHMKLRLPKRSSES